MRGPPPQPGRVRSRRRKLERKRQPTLPDGEGVTFLPSPEKTVTQSSSERRPGTFRMHKGGGAAAQPGTPGPSRGWKAADQQEKKKGGVCGCVCVCVTASLRSTAEMNTTPQITGASVKLEHEIKLKIENKQIGFLPRVNYDGTRDLPRPLGPPLRPPRTFSLCPRRGLPHLEP